MKPFVTLEARACPLPVANVDTDQLIPARFMKQPRSAGYCAFLLHDLRREAGNPAAVLDDPRHAGAQVLVARRNFGCGSSREAAVYALADHGIRCVIAPSFGDIFASNAVKNGLLPARLPEDQVDELLQDALVLGGGPLEVDLPSQTIRVGNKVFSFEIEPVWKTQLVNGWDDIDMTRSYAAEIERFATQDATARPWAAPAG
jgi:3-isopropylmalate/(R)-2-methylmalate dehydratase small subunit